MASTNDPNGVNEAMTLEQVAHSYGIPLPQLRRRVVAGAVPGAYTVDGEGGREWRVPTASLLRLGYEPRRRAQVPDASPARLEPFTNRPEPVPPPQGGGHDASASQTERTVRIPHQVEADYRRLEHDRTTVEAARRALKDQDARLKEERLRLDKDRRNVEDLCRVLATELALLRAEREALDAERRCLQAERDVVGRAAPQTVPRQVEPHTTNLPTTGQPSLLDLIREQ